MKYAFKYRLYPNQEQSVLLSKTFGCVRFIYNLMLQDKIDFYKEKKEMLKNTPAQYKEEYPWLKDLQSMVLYETVIAIDEDTGLSASVTVDEMEFDIVKEKITAAKLTNYKAYNVKNVGGFNVLDNSITGDKLTDEAGEQLISSAVNSATESATEYTDQKAYQTRQQASQDTSEAITDYDTQIKSWIAQNYQPLPTT